MSSDGETAAFDAPRSAFDVPPPPTAESAAPARAGWSGSDLVIGSALVVLIIALFLPWFGETVRLGSSAPISGKGDGPAAHGYLWAVFTLAILALAVLVARDFISRLPGNLPSAEQVLVGATGLSLALCILGLVVRPAGYSTTGSATAAAQILNHLSISIGWSYGGFVAVVAAAVAFIAAFGIAGPIHPAGRAARAARSAWRRPGSGPAA